MNTLANIQELARALRNMIRTGLVVETNLKAGRCRVQTGGMCTDWLQWLTCRAGRSRTWWAPSVGEQVLILAVGGELDTAFVLPGIYSGDNPAPSASADALHIRFPDGAVIEYEPETSALTVSPSNYSNFDSRYVRDIRLGTRVVQTMQKGVMYEKAGHVITGLGIVGEVDGDDPAVFRPIQKYINGTWYNVAQV
ncbi:TPA: phage baseplate assembly protein V [Escherichia coli]